MNDKPIILTGKDAARFNEGIKNVVPNPEERKRVLEVYEKFHAIEVVVAKCDTCGDISHCYKTQDGKFYICRFCNSTQPHAQ